mmetsp:Transcript_17904/g.33191  ORF Transcript_17904/g.33191 Transcript_17904/m.33191 type:complete len:344 (-) Transcript_17904:354-1385(-)
MMANNLMVPALVAGNAVILKPSEETPLIAQEFFGRLADALPESVLQIVHGDGQVGTYLVESPNVNMIAFTGSQAAGRDIMSRAGKTLKRLVMELGGNDPLIVMKDADLDKAARFAIGGGFENSGQMCTSVERVYVDEEIASEYMEKLVNLAKDHSTVGPWNGTDVNIGPIINAKQHAKILDHIMDAKEKGGHFLLGGEDDSYNPPYIAATIIANMTPDMKMEQEETFGPVIGISTYTTVDEAIDRANDSVYGLGAVVFGQDDGIFTAQEVAAQLEAGMVGINTAQGLSGGPWVGAKQSGFGYHGTIEGHRQFTQIKSVAIDHSSVKGEDSNACPALKFRKMYS